MRIVIINEFIRLLWGLNELIKWIKSLDPLFFSSTVTPFIPLCDLKHYLYAENSQVQVFSPFISPELQTYMSSFFRSLLGCSVKHLRLNIFKLWTADRLRNKPFLPAAFFVDGNFILLVPQARNLGVILDSHSTCSASGNPVASIFQSYPRSSVFLPLPLLPYWSKPLSSRRCCNSPLLPPLPLSPKSILHAVARLILVRI